MRKGEALSVSNLSRHRQALMGIAIIGIILFHGRAAISGGAVVRYGFAGIKYFLQIGVDIFFLLSGLGCGYSLEVSGFEEHYRTKSLQFWGRRLRRILPKYLFVTTAYCIICALRSNSFSWRIAVEEYSLVTFFTKGKLTEWFIAGILVLYFLTPFLYRLMASGVKRFYVLTGFIVVSALAISLSNVPDSFKTVNEIFITRIPVYMTGIAFSRKLKNQDGILRRGTALLLLAVLSACYAGNRLFNNTNEMCVERLLFWPTAVLLSLLFADGIEKGRLPWEALFCFFGSVSLELYLTHEKILGLFQWSDQYPLWYSWLFDGAAILIAVGAAVLVHRLFAAFERRRVKP